MDTKNNTQTTERDQTLPRRNSSSPDLSYRDIMGIIGEVLKGKTQEEFEQVTSAFQKTHDLLDTFNDNEKEGVVKILSKIMKASGAFDS